MTAGAPLASAATTWAKDRSAYDAAVTSPTVVDCSTKELTLSVTAGLSGMGDVSAVLLLRNIGPTPCHLTGYPTILLRNSMDQEAKAVQTPHGVAGGLPASAPIPTLLLRTDDVASAVIEDFDVPSGATTICPSCSAFTVTLPGQPASVTLNRQMEICSALNAHPFVMGFNGSYPTGEVSGTAPGCTSTAYVLQVSAFSAADLVAENRRISRPHCWKALPVSRQARPISDSLRARPIVPGCRGPRRPGRAPREIRRMCDGTNQVGSPKPAGADRLSSRIRLILRSRPCGDRPLTTGAARLTHALLQARRDRRSARLSWALMLCVVAST